MFRRLLLSALLLLLSLPALAYWNTNWAYRTQVTLTSAQARTDYTVTLNLSASDLYSAYNWSSAGNDLRVIAGNDTTPLNFYIKSWNASARTASVVIRFPSLAAGANTFYLYYGNNSAPAASDVSSVLQRGTLYRSRRSDIDPTGWAEAYAQLSNPLTTGYGERMVADFTNVENSDLPNGSNTNFVAYVTARFTTTGSGYFYFRFGADFGRGGELRVDGVTLESQWNDDLWWEKDWRNNGSDGRRDGVLEGGIYLTGNDEHIIEVLGSEGGNDGGMSLQVCSGSCATNSNGWQAFSTSIYSSIYAPAPGTDTTVNVQVGDTIVRGLELGVSVTAPQYWYQNTSQSLSVLVRNNGTQSVSSHYVYVGIDTDLAVTSMGGTGWSCRSNASYNNTRYYDCNYSGSAITSGNSFPAIVAQVVPGNSTDNIGYFSAQMWPGDVNSSNDYVTGSRSYILAATGLSCGNAGQGLWGSFYSYTTSAWRTGYVDTQAEFNSLITLGRANGADGSRLLSAIDGQGNPFGNSNYFLGVFSGYLYIPADGEWTFAIDGDDATEVLIDDILITARYGPNTSAGSPQNRVTKILQAGYHKIEYHIQNHGGNSGYYLYMGQGNTASATLAKVSSSRFRQCDAVFNLALTSSVLVESDPVNGTSNAKAIPGARLLIRVVASNQGLLAPDANSVTIVQAIPEQSKLLLNNGTPVTVTDGDGAGGQLSGLTLSSVQYSATGNSNADFTFTPVADADGANQNVRYMKLNFSGTMNTANGTQVPQLTYRFRTLVQ